MISLENIINDLLDEGYDEELAPAKLCQDIILKAISKSKLSRNVTIKGGVVMRGITNNIRRATKDLDMDFIRYSISDESIEIVSEYVNRDEQKVAIVLEVSESDLMDLLKCL